MNLKKSLLVAVPALAMAVGALAFSFTASKKGAIEADAADYTTSNRVLTIENNSVTATFNVSNSNLSMEGWLLCLFESKPSFDPSTRKLTDSNNVHPYSTSGCSHYFFVSSNLQSGNITINWASNSNDQKTTWSSDGATVTAGNTLEDCLASETDWYFVIGPRHKADYGDSHSAEDVGAGYNDYWENCDYYVGRKSTFDGNLPSGQIYLDLTESSYWENYDGDGKVKFGIYFWDDNDDKYNDFSSFATETSTGSHIYVASYELGFHPTKMKAVRFKSTAPTPSWDYDYNETQNLDFYEHGVVGVTIKYEYEVEKDYSWSDALATIDGLDSTIILDHYKRNSDGHSEHYNENVSLKAGDTFTISYNGESYSDFRIYTTISDDFEIEGGEVKCTKAGDYALYFDTNDSITNKLYITSPSVASADEWAQSFMNGECASTKTNWSDLGTSYSKLSSEAKALFVATEHESDPTKQLTGYVAQAVQRYDYVLVLYGTGSYSDFMGRVDAGKVTPKQSSISKTVINGDNTAMIVTIVSMISVAGLGAFLFYKKKRAQD